MRYLLIILGLLLISCELFEEEDAEKGICVFYEFTSLNGAYVNDYSCWNDALETACNGTWYLNQSCEEFCEEKITEEDTLCNVY
mgnify:CR=1 FL=1